MVLAGLNLPHLPGDELMAHLHAIRPDLPVILCSNSFHQNGQKRKFPRAAGKLAKPFTFDTLKGMLEALSNRIKP